MHLIDLTHTAHTRVQTGIQVVCRALYDELAKRQAAQSVTWDRYAKQWRGLEAWECANLNLRAACDDESGDGTKDDGGRAKPTKRSGQWPLHARLRGRWQRLRRQRSPSPEEARKALAVSIPLPPNTEPTKASLTHTNRSGLIVPELFRPGLVRHAQLFPFTSGPRVAIFYDAIPLKFPELSPAKTVAFFPSYLRSLLQFDGIAAISEDSAQTLRDYFLWLGVTHTPQITAIPLGAHLPSAIPVPLDTDSEAHTPPTILTVGSIEGRKNHLALLDAAEMLWTKGRRFKLHIIGLAQSETGRAALEKIAALQAAGRPLYYAGHAPRRAVEAAYAQCAFTVYPSIIEGFGLPVIESLARGRPCICSGRGALGEVSRGGGALALDEVSAPRIATAIDSLLQNPARRTELAAEARARRFRNWAEYTDDLLNWMNTLTPRSD